MKRFYDLFNKNVDVPYNAKAARKQVQVDLSFVEYRYPIKRYTLFYMIEDSYKSYKMHRNQE
jgi:hypothetical protein